MPAAEALRSLAVLALPSYMETSGLALLEAMAAGIPAVATPGRRDRGDGAAGRGDAGRAGRPAALAAAILALLDDPCGADRARAGAAAAERTAARTAERMLEVYLRRS